VAHGHLLDLEGGDVLAATQDHLLRGGKLDPRLPLIKDDNQ
jgi:hypothetical protein